MRFGRCLWQRLDDGTVRHRIWLVGEGGDDEVGGPFRDLHQPELSRGVEQAMISKSQMSALIEELQRADALSADAADRVRSLGKVENLAFADRREVDRTTRIDSFLD
jgi:hypothetical protein